MRSPDNTEAECAEGWGLQEMCKDLQQGRLCSYPAASEHSRVPANRGEGGSGLRASTCPRLAPPRLAEPEATAPPSLCVPAPRSAAVSTVSQHCCLREEGDPIPDQAAFQERQ